MCSIFAGSPDFGRKYERKKSILDQLNKENHLMSSYSPPGGIKEIACSVSNLHSSTNIDLTRKIRRIKSTSGALAKFERFFSSKHSNIQAMRIKTYLMSSYSPSGGIKEIACSVSNLLSLTHWWNWQSSIAIALLDLVASSPAFPLGSDFVF